MCYNGGMDVEVDGILVAAGELKEPLATLRQLAFSFDELNIDDERIRKEMISVSDMAIRQVNDLMKLRRLESGMFAMEPVPVRAVCDDVTRELMQLFGCDRQDLFVKYTSGVGLVVANRELLESVVWNFLLSALRYTDGDVRSELIVRDCHDKVRVSVRDYGPALPMDIWRELKAGWVRRPTSIAMRPGTSGLGLYISSKFSKYMNAKVGAVRHRDGTSFYVDLLKSKQASLF